MLSLRRLVAGFCWLLRRGWLIKPELSRVSAPAEVVLSRPDMAPAKLVSPPGPMKWQLACGLKAEGVGGPSYFTCSLRASAT